MDERMRYRAVERLCVELCRCVGREATRVPAARQLVRLPMRSRVRAREEARISGRCCAPTAASVTRGETQTVTRMARGHEREEVGNVQGTGKKKPAGGAGGAQVTHQPGAARGGPPRASESEGRRSGG